MPVRSERLAAGNILLAPAADFVLYTVPAGRQTIIRSLIVYSVANALNAALAERFRVAGVTRFAWNFGALATGASDVNEIWRVLESGDALLLRSDLGQTVHFWLSGAELVI